MGQSRREWRQAELKLGQGAEPWVLVRHRNGTFRLPLDAPVSDVLEGIARGWTMSTRPSTPSASSVRVPLDELLRLWANAARHGEPPPV